MVEVIFSECDDAAEWSTNSVSPGPFVDTVDFPPGGFNASVKATAANNPGWFMILAKWASIDASTIPILSLPIKVSLAETYSSTWVDIYTSDGGDYRYPITILANTWTNVLIDLSKQADSNGNFPNLALIQAVRIFYESGGAEPQTVGIGRIVFRSLGNAAQWNLEIATSPINGGVTNPSGNISVDTETGITVSAIANLGHVFSKWTLDGMDTGTSTTIQIPPQTIGTTHTLTATFTPIKQSSLSLVAIATSVALLGYAILKI